MYSSFKYSMTHLVQCLLKYLRLPLTMLGGMKYKNVKAAYSSGVIIEVSHYIAGAGDVTTTATISAVVRLTQ